MPFRLTWGDLGWNDGEIKFYTIDNSKFGGWQYAMPRDCVKVLAAAGYTNPPTAGNKEVPVHWVLKKVVEGAVTASSAVPAPR